MFDLKLLLIDQKTNEKIMIKLIISKKNFKTKLTLTFFLFIIILDTKKLSKVYL